MLSHVTGLQEARKWGGSDKKENLDYSEKSDGVRGASDDSGAESINMQQKSMVDIDEDFDSSDSDSQVLCIQIALVYMYQAFFQSLAAALQCKTGTCSFQLTPRAAVT